MVKSNHPLQIRLTEPVIFLKGPSTGLDFRGRPQAIAADAQPAMLRGLLTLRLSKPTRIRKIEIKLEGKARTEWPEGIGPRRMDTSEEHVIISEKATYFNAIRSESRSDMRRAASLGPGVSTAMIDIDDDFFHSEATTPVETDHESHEYIGRGRQRHTPGQVPRSASAMPGGHDMMGWHRGGSSTESTEGDETFLPIRNLSMRDRGPSPAYTPLPESSSEGRHSSLRNPLSGSNLSPIPSAPHSAATSDRGESTSTERRRTAPSQLARSGLADEPLIEDSQTSSPAEIDHELGESETVPPVPVRPSILEHAGHRHGSGSAGEVRFAPTAVPHDASHHHDDATRDESEAEAGPVSEPLEEVRRGRTASIRTMNSTHSASSSSTHGEHGAVHASSGHTEQHPVMSGIQTAVPSPNHSAAPSPAPSVHANPSTDHLPRSSMSSASLTGDGHSSSNPTSANESRRSSLLGLHTGHSAGPSSSSTDSQEVRQGRKTRAGSASTIVINRNNASQSASGSRPPETRSNSGRSVSSSSPHPSQYAPSTHGRATPTHEEHAQHRHLKFSLASAFGVVKDRMSSKSRSRAGSRAPSRAHSRGPSRAPSIDESAGYRPSDNGTSMSRGGSGSGYARANGVVSALPPHLIDLDERTNRFGRMGLDDFVPPSVFARGSSTGRSRSTDRTASPARHREGERSPSRNRGRNKGMKVLTGALDVLEGKHHEEEGEHLHNWKEFKKGTYNYPISFPIPVDAPPTLHAEFGSVVYRLKATVVRAGALTTNLVEDLEVIMIATPQEDDLEETENVIVERQWEEQMRYQIALHGKAFPIGGMIPISIRLMPLMKCKVHRLTVALEEKTDYFAQEKKVARHETPRRFTLLFVKQPERLERLFPLLPVISDDPNAAKDSPVAQLAAQAAVNNPSPDAFDPENEDSVYATLLDPLGPWHLEKNLQLPDCASGVKFTSKHEKTNIAVGHWLKVTIRVERGDDVAVDAKGRRKQFDIIIETPIKILDCRVNPQYNSLPTYTPQHPSSMSAPGVCSIHSGQSKNFAPIASSRDIDPLVAAAPTAMGQLEGRGESSRGRSSTRDLNGHARHDEDTLLERNIVYDRLMSGQETETGELPPTYVEAVANASRSVSRNGSRVGLDGAAGSPYDHPGVETIEERGRDPGSRLEGVIEFGSRSRERDGRSRSRLRLG